MKIFNLVLPLFLYGISLNAQTVFDRLDDPNANFNDVSTYLNTYFQTHPKGKGSGYKHFKRWESEMKFWIDENGNRLSPTHYQTELQKFNSSAANKKTSSTTVANWIELGPLAWNYSGSWAPGLGRIDAVAIHPLNTNIIYAGSPNGGCWKTVNGGTNWTSLTDGQLFMKIGDVEVDPTNINTVYIGTMGLGFLKSTNGGTTLSASGTGLPSAANIRKIIVDPTNTANIIVATSSGIYRSTNSAATWTLSFAGSFYDAEFQPGNSSVVYACGKDFYRSTNSGANFTKITAGISVNDVMRLAVSANNPNLVCVVQCAGNIFGKFYKSIDAGQTFTTTITGDPLSGTNFFGYEPTGLDNAGQGGYNIDVAISPTDANEIHIAGINTWKSTDGGFIWAPTTEWTYPNTTGYTHCDVHALEYIGNQLFVGSDGGLSVSTDNGDNFTPISSGMGIRMLYRLGCSATDPTIIAEGAQDNGGSIRTAAGWIDWIGADGMETAVSQTDANTIYGSSQYGSFYMTLDAGVTYTDMVMPETTGNWTTPFVIDPNNSSTLYSGYSELYKSNDQGTNWTAISSLAMGLLDHITVAPSNSNYIYISSGNSIYKTVDGGANWTSISLGLGAATINGIAVHNSDPDKVVIAASGSKIFTSINGGSTWINATTNLPAVTARCVIYQNDPSEGIYVGTNTGVYFKDKTMTNWLAYSTNLPTVAINELEIHEGTSKLRAASYGRGIWETDLYAPFSAVNIKTISNDNYASIFPNPAKQDLNIILNESQLFEGTISIESIDGKLIYNKEISATSNRIKIDVSQFANGCYFIHIKNKDRVITRKLLIE